MKINILGASGSGVTTLGTALSLRMGIDFFDSDNFFWEKSEVPFSIKVDPSTRDKNIIAALNQTDNWILGGSVINWSKEIHAQFDLIIFLHIPQTVRLERLKARELKRYGKAIENDAFRKSKYEKFMAWAKDYDEMKGIANRTIKAHTLWLEKQTATKINLLGEMELDEKIERVLDKVKALS